jgi:hypothetical protein
MTLFENMTFKDIIRSRVDPKSNMAGALLRRRETQTWENAM